MLPFFTEQYGNAASVGHRLGREAEKAVSDARRQVAALIGASPGEIIWTSGATEANNLAIKGVMAAGQPKGRKHIVTQATEHKAVLDPIQRLAREGFSITVLPVDHHGKVNLEQFRISLRQDTALVSIMWANNETGTVQDIAGLVSAAKAVVPSVVFHCDATQAAGKLPEVDVSVGIDLMSLTAHKLYGPKGCGALYVRRTRPSVSIRSLIDGGGHEKGLRSGTLNVPGIVGFGKACELAGQCVVNERERVSRLRDRLWLLLSSQLDGIHLNGPSDARLPNTLSVAFDGASAESMMMACDDICFSAGSACTIASIEPSHVLRAMGFSESRCFSSLRFSLGRSNSAVHVDYAAERLITVVRSLRSLREV